LGKVHPPPTPEMAQEVQRLFDNDEITDTDILIMGGHEDGIIAWGKNFEVAFDLLENL